LPSGGNLMAISEHTDLLPANREAFIESADDLAGTGPVLRKCYDYWCGLRDRAGGRLPQRAMIDPADITGLLTYFRLVDLYEGDVLMPRYRLIGTGGRDVMGIDATGKRFIDLYDKATYEAGIARYRQIIERRLPFYFVGPVTLEGRGFISTERLMLPLGDAKGDVVGICGVTVAVAGAERS
jgi:hypothetical protein